MGYRCVATSVEGFVQQLATCYLRHGYYFFVQGRVPDGRDPYEIDKKLLEKFEIALTTGQRCYRKRLGLANVHYLRYAGTNEWVMVATHGRHVWWEEHHHPCPQRNQVKDAREVPIVFQGYSIRVRQGHYLRKLPGESRAQPDRSLRVRVMIGRAAYRYLKAEFLEAATRKSATDLAAKFSRLPFEPYAPIRKQLLQILRMVNAKRRTAALDRLPGKIVRTKRRIVKPFDPAWRDFAETLAPVVAE